MAQRLAVEVASDDSLKGWLRTYSIKESVGPVFNREMAKGPGYRGFSDSELASVLSWDHS